MKKITAIISLMVSVSAFSASSSKCPGEDGYFYTNYRTTNNPQEGGFVSYTATIDDNHEIVIGKMAAVCENAIILDQAKINGSAIIRGDAQISGKAIISGDVIIEGDVTVSGSSVIRGKGILSKGDYHDIRKTVDNQSSQPSSVSAEDLAVKVQQFVKRYSSLKPEDGSFYEGKTTLSQSISFSGACSVTIKKSRTNPLKDSSFLGDSEVSFNLKDVSNFLIEFYSPGLSTVNIQMDNKESKAHRKYKYSKTSVWVEGGRSVWYNQHVTYNQRTVESLELNTKKEAESLMVLLDNLRKACSK